MNLHLLHHWLVSMRGGEKVLEQFCRMFPRAPVHTLVHDNRGDAVSDTIRRHPIHTTRLDRLPGAVKYYKSMLPLHPALIGSHRVEADFILSSDAALIKGMNNVNDVPHVCYCHSPPRYLWDLQDEYTASMPFPKRVLFESLTPYLRKYDRKAADGVDHFIANSAYVKDRIRRVYGRDSTVIHPPVALDAFSPNRPPEAFYLMVSALVPYKKVELAVRAFNQLGKPLIIIGDGSERTKLQKIAEPNVQILGSQPYSVVKDHFERCKAFIFPGIEDFGITPLEAQAAGKPVLAYREGGALETVKENETGLFFEEQTPEHLLNVVQQFEKQEESFSAADCRENAERFSPQQFRTQIKNFLTSRYPSYFEQYEWETEGE